MVVDSPGQTLFHKTTGHGDSHTEVTWEPSASTLHGTESPTICQLHYDFNSVCFLKAKSFFVVRIIEVV